MRRLLLLPAIVLAGLAMTPLASAQPGGQPDQGSGPPAGGYMMGRGMMGAGPQGGGWMMGRGMMHGGPMMMGMGMGGCMSGQWLDGQLAFLKAELKPTDAQEKQWDEFAKVLRSNAGSMSAMHKEMRNTGNWSKLSAPDRMEKHVEMMAQHLAAAQAMVAASKPFYSSLSDEQKKTFDSLMPMCMGMM